MGYLYMTLIDKACYERGCACYDDRVDDDAVEVVLAQTQEPVVYQCPRCATSMQVDLTAKAALAQTQEPWCMKMNDCKTKCEDCPDEPPQRTEQEPVAYYLPHKGFYWAKPTRISAPTIADVEPLPLYTHPPQRTWVGLTNNELQPIADEYRILFGSWVEDFARAIEAKLKEKNT